MLGIWYGMSAYWITRGLRALPYLRNVYVDGIKPLSCNLCMGTWVSVLLTAWLYWYTDGWDRALWSAPVGMVTSMWLLDGYDKLRRSTHEIQLPKEENGGNA